MSETTGIGRRELLRLLTGAAAGVTIEGCSRGNGVQRVLGLGIPTDEGEGKEDMRPWERYPEKTELIMLADRPPLLETPMHYFLQDITPNDAYFVRWHFAGLPTRVDLRTFRLNISGAVQKPLQLSFDDLRKEFEPVGGVVFNQCAGNSRSFFRPQVTGAEWTNGAMGNAHYTGVRLRDLLSAAGVKHGAVEASFRGLDEPPLQSSPHFEKPLPIDLALSGEPFVAYEMNGAPLPMLNGFPLRLVVPGWFATYWVKALSQITIRTEPLENFWVKTAYRVPATPDRSESHDHPAALTTPLTTYPTRSIFISPEGLKPLHRNKPVPIEGIAVDDGAGIVRVEVSTDGGRTWVDAQLDPIIDRYAWRRWRLKWKPSRAGTYVLKCKATNARGETQPDSEWNHGGYSSHSIQMLPVEVL